MKVEKTTYHKLWDAAKAVLKGKFTVKCSCQKNRNVSNLNFFKKSGKKEQIIKQTAEKKLLKF